MCQIIFLRRRLREKRRSASVDVYISIYYVCSMKQSGNYVTPELLGKSVKRVSFTHIVCAEVGGNTSMKEKVRVSTWSKFFHRNVGNIETVEKEAQHPLCHVKGSKAGPD